MNYVIFDLEFNQRHPSLKSSNEDKQSSLLFEIIQIGAIKINSNYKTLSTFNELINPSVHTLLHPYVETLTNLKNEDLENADCFTTIFNNFLDFLGNEEIIFVVWGASDIKELIKNADFFNIPSNIKNIKYIDIQDYASKLFKYPKGSRIGLKNAIEYLNLPINCEFHDALNDAYYTALIFSSIHNKDMLPKAYIPSKKSKLKINKPVVNPVALINQFEKMYNRNLTTDEKSMIELAYTMGRTNQFTK